MCVSLSASFLTRPHCQMLWCELNLSFTSASWVTQGESLKLSVPRFPQHLLIVTIKLTPTPHPVGLAWALLLGSHSLLASSSQHWSPWTAAVPLDGD